MSDNALIRALRSFGQGASNAVASNVSAPVDGIAWLLRKGGLPIPQNPVGGSDWMAQQGLTATPQNRIAGLLGETAGMVGPAVVQAAAPKIAGGLLALDDKAMDMARQGIERRMVSGGMIQPATVWHGSPHKFDKFDSSKIGTGEGAQAYGHGLYLAESPDVAKSYTKLNSVTNPTQLVRLRDAAPKGSGEWKHYDDLLQKLDGSLYKVDLPDNAIARMLDWDKPLSQQAPEVRQALTKIANSDEQVMKQFRALGPNATADQAYAALTQNAVRAKKYEGMRAGIPEPDAMPSLAYGQDAASRLLRQQGIPGIRYLDGGSRGAGQGSSNFVVFPGQEDILKILERNGVPIK